MDIKNIDWWESLHQVINSFIELAFKTPALEKFKPLETICLMFIDWLFSCNSKDEDLKTTNKNTFFSNL